MLATTSPASLRPPRRLLVVKFAEIGDALLITPALQALRAGLPDTTIDALTTSGGAAVLRRSSLCDDVRVFDKHRFDTPRQLMQPQNIAAAARLAWQLRTAGYDTVLLFHHLSTRFGALKYAMFCLATGARQRLGLDNGRGWFLTHAVQDQGYGARHESDYALSVARLLVPDAPRRAPVFPIAAEEHERAAHLLASADAQAGPLIALHPGSGGYAPARRWPVARWAVVADTLIERGAVLVLVGGAEEADLRRSMLAQMRHAGRVLDLGGRTSLDELAAVLARCTLFVGNDGGIMHLAATTGVPVVAPYGPTSPRSWGPWSAEPWQCTHSYPNGVDALRAGPHLTLKAALSCSPCIYRGTGLGTPAGCPDRTCLDRIGVGQVLDSIETVLAERGGRSA
jgi:ADP-heptose:LPS heptosyltransferase